MEIVPSLGLPGGSADKESACNVGDLGSTPGLGSSSGEGNSYPLQYCGLALPHPTPQKLVYVNIF